jgi:hypothetical protein
MAEEQQNNQIDFSVDTGNLYREEGFTDMKVASIRKLVPVTPDGTEDKGRTNVYIGTSQLMSPEGPVPLQAVLSANNLSEAIEIFPSAMKDALGKMIEQVKAMQEKEKDDSRIIVPGR